VVEEGADLLGGPVDLVGVLVEKGEQELFASVAVGGLAGSAGQACELLDGLVDPGGLVYAELAEPFVDRPELVLLSEDDAVELADDVGGVVESAVVAGWGEKESDQGQVERQGEGQDFVGVELAVAVAFVGPFDGGDAGLGEPLAEEPFQGSCCVFLGPAP
jgi:hypothetical protein